MSVCASPYDDQADASVLCAPDAAMKNSGNDDESTDSEIDEDSFVMSFDRIEEPRAQEAEKGGKEQEGGEEHEWEDEEKKQLELRFEQMVQVLVECYRTSKEIVWRWFEPYHWDGRIVLILSDNYDDKPNSGGYKEFMELLCRQGAEKGTAMLTPNQYVVNACFELAKNNSSDENSKREQLHIARHLYAKIEPLVTNLKETDDCRRLVEAINSLFHLIPGLRRKHKNNYTNVTDEILEMVKIPMLHVVKPELRLPDETQNRIVTFHIFFVVCARLEYKIAVPSSLSFVKEFVNEWATSPYLYDLDRTTPLVDLVPLSFVYALLSVWRIWTTDRQTSSQRIKLGALFKYTWKIVCGDTDADNLNQPLARILEREKGFPPCIFGAIDFLMYAPEAFLHEHNLEAEDCLKRYMSLLSSTRFKDRALEGVTAECSLYVCLKELYVEDGKHLSSALSLLEIFCQKYLFKKRIPEGYLNMTEGLVDAQDKRSFMNKFLEEYAKSPFASMLKAMMDVQKARTDLKSLIGNEAALVGSQDAQLTAYTQYAKGETQAYTDSLIFVTTTVKVFGGKIRTERLQEVQRDFLERRRALPNSEEAIVDNSRTTAILSILGKRPKPEN
ncbi:hypothetical protein CYMTET_37286 [Cymbomonas tetramitiformis]|uniref:Uncharacterized protein n=1 Tax=Cymbomonas tetramitiformis TaxID=36881 RepID=A0AAE0CGL7_9CHLO|nr:hypothetical protein CYMTET_37286 [Cymbomonas tetramitiformis]